MKRLFNIRVSVDNGATLLIAYEKRTIEDVRRFMPIETPRLAWQGIQSLECGEVFTYQPSLARWEVTRVV